MATNVVAKIVGRLDELRQGQMDLFDMEMQAHRLWLQEIVPEASKTFSAEQLGLPKTPSHNKKKRALTKGRGRKQAVVESDEEGDEKDSTPTAPTTSGRRVRESTARARESIVPASTRSTRATARASIQVSVQQEPIADAPQPMDTAAPGTPPTVVKSTKTRKGLTDQTNSNIAAAPLSAPPQKSPSPKKKATKASPKASPKAIAPHTEVDMPLQPQSQTQPKFEIASKPEPKKKASPKKKPAAAQRLHSKAQEAEATKEAGEAAAYNPPATKKAKTPEKIISTTPTSAKEFGRPNPASPTTPTTARKAAIASATPSTTVKAGFFASRTINESTASIASVEISALKTKRLVKDAVARMETPGKEVRPTRKTRSKDRLLKELKGSVSDLTQRIEESVSSSTSSASASHEASAIEQIAGEKKGLKRKSDLEAEATTSTVKSTSALDATAASRRNPIRLSAEARKASELINASLDAPPTKKNSLDAAAGESFDVPFGESSSSSIAETSIFGSDRVANLNGVAPRAEAELVACATKLPKRTSDEAVFKTGFSNSKTHLVGRLSDSPQSLESSSAPEEVPAEETPAGVPPTKKTPSNIAVFSRSFLPMDKPAMEKKKAPIEVKALKAADALRAAEEKRQKEREERQTMIKKRHQEVQERISMEKKEEAERLERERVRADEAVRVALEKKAEEEKRFLEAKQRNEERLRRVEENKVKEQKKEEERRIEAERKAREEQQRAEDERKRREEAEKEKARIEEKKREDARNKKLLMDKMKAMTDAMAAKKQEIELHKRLLAEKETEEIAKREETARREKEEEERAQEVRREARRLEEEEEARRVEAEESARKQQQLLAMKQQQQQRQQQEAVARAVAPSTNLAPPTMQPLTMANLKSHETQFAEAKPACNPEDNYDINSIKSEGSTDDDEEPRHKVPAWAQGPALKAAIFSQFLSEKDATEIFPMMSPPNLSKIFPNKTKPRYKTRTSSALWEDSPRHPGNMRKIF